LVKQLEKVIATMETKMLSQKLVAIHLIEIHKILLPKYTYNTGEKCSVSMSAPQAIAFCIAFCKEKSTDPLSMATVLTITNDLNKKFA